MSIDKAKAWCIYDQENGRLLGNLSTREVQVLVSMLSSEQLIYLWVWCSEWSEWKSATLIDELVDTSSLDLSFPSEIPTPPKAINASGPGSMPELSSDKTVRSSAKKQAEDPTTLRKHKRFEIRLPVAIYVNDQIFETHSRDISLGGIQVEDELPDWVAGYGSLVFTLTQGEKIEVICSVVEDQKLGDKYRLEILPSAQFDQLKEWLQTTVV